jgi:hypothetical protein
MCFPLWKGRIMTFSKLLSCAAIFAIAAMPFTLLVSAYADTYKFFDLQSDEGFGIFGIDTAGDVVIQTDTNRIGPCGMPSNQDHPCYQTFVNGVFSSVSDTVPFLAYDNGTPCVPSLPSGVFFGVMNGVCNNGREVFVASTSTLDLPHIFTGPDPVADLLNGSFQSGVEASAFTPFLNASGDVAWMDPFEEEIFEAVDLTTNVVPEPGTLVLLATGVLGAAGALGRRLTSNLR